MSTLLPTSWQWTCSRSPSIATCHEGIFLSSSAAFSNSKHRQPTCCLLLRLEELSIYCRRRSRRGRRGILVEPTPCGLRYRATEAGDCVRIPIKLGVIGTMQEGQHGNGAVEPELELQFINNGTDVECAIPNNAARSVSKDPPKPPSELQCIGTGSDVECVISNVDTTALATREDQASMECIGIGTDVECVIRNTNGSPNSNYKVAARATSIVKSKETSLDSSTESTFLLGNERKQDSFLVTTWEYLVLISPFFFWGTAMVAMKGVLPKAGPLFVAATRLIPSGFLLVAFATYQKRKQPSGFNAWLAIALFALVDASCFQGFLAEGLKRTSAGLGSVIIDSQPLTVALLASILFGESIGALGAVGLATGVIGLLLLEVPTHVIEDFLKGHAVSNVGHSSTLSSTAVQANEWSIWDSGEWWMLLAAQSMAVGTVMVRWLCQFADPVMATGWHMVLGGLPLLALATFQHDPALDSHIGDLRLVDWLALLYTSIFGSAVSYGVFFYNASQGSLTKLSSLTFLTPMFAALFGFVFLNETLNATQIVGALVTLASIFLINTKTASSEKDGIV